VRLLLDTHVVLWQLEGSRAVHRRARDAIEQAGELLFSVVSFAAIGVKAAIGKLSVPRDLHDQVLQSGLRILGLAPDHGLAVADLPMHHRDPFDRLLIAQARFERLTIVTADRRFAAYDVPLVYAGVG
jgi:PIN domain nuclease of toxin-antitoxin system